MIALVICGVAFFLVWLYAQYSSTKIWAEGQKRQCELEGKKFELQVMLNDIDDIERAKRNGSPY